MSRPAFLVLQIAISEAEAQVNSIPSTLALRWSYVLFCQPTVILKGHWLNELVSNSYDYSYSTWGKIDLF